MSDSTQQSFDSLMELALKRCRNEGETDMVRKAYELAAEAHKNVLLHASGEPFIAGPVEVAKIVVARIGLGYKSICAALLRDVVGSTQWTVEDLRKLFGDKIASLVDGLVRVKSLFRSAVAGTDAESRQAENLKLLLLTMGDDVRVVLIQLAFCLRECRHLDSVPESRREQVLNETKSIFIPLAHRLGLYAIKSEMENIWLRYREPAAYAEIEDAVSKDSAGKAKALEEFIEPIRKLLEGRGMNFEIKKRIKTPYSIWHKMQTKQVPLTQIYDLYAVRIIFELDTDSMEAEREQAYVIYSMVTGLYRDKPSRMRDWIKQPKGNGYEALHCTLMSPEGMWVEVQIRSRRMDDIAEKGIAAHWAYKNDGYLHESDSNVDRWLAKVQEILQSGSADSLDLLDIIQGDLGTGEIVVFTPKGEQRSIQKGATALDFAYMVHTGVGNQAIAAKINSKLCPLSQPLKAGDQVEIITARNASPKEEWQGFLRTRYARRKLGEWFKEHGAEQASERESPSELILNVRITGQDRPGLNDEIATALRRIDGITDVTISNL